MASQTFSNPYTRRHAAAPSFGVIDRFNPSTGGINPHSVSVESIDAGVLSDLLNAASRQKATPRPGAHFGGSGGPASPIVGDTSGLSRPQRAKIVRAQSEDKEPTEPTDDPGTAVELVTPVYPGPKTGPYGMTAEVLHPYAPDYSPFHPDNSLTGGLARKALGSGVISPTRVFAPGEIRPGL